MAKWKKENYNQKAQEFFDIDYLEKLNEEERDWILQFLDETLSNNHRIGYIMKKLKNYKTDVKSMIDCETNARNRDLFSLVKSTSAIFEYNEFHKELNDLMIEDREYIQIAKEFSLEKTMNFLMDESLKELEKCSDFEKEKDVLKRFLYQYENAKRIYKKTGGNIKKTRRKRRRISPSEKNT